MYFDRVRNRWVAIPKAEHPEFKKYIRKLANQLPIHEKLFSPDAGLGWRLLFLAGLPLIAPAIFLYGYLRALLTGEDI